MIRVVLVDDQPVVRSGLRMMLQDEDDVTVTGEASDGVDALRLVRAQPVDVVVMDLRMPGMDGITATARLARDHPDVRVLVLTTFDDDEHLYRALAAGARGFLTKYAAGDQVVHAIRAVARDEPAFSPHVLSRIVEQAARHLGAHEADAGILPDVLERLTEREREVLRLLPSGASNQDIADHLHMSVTTVKTHLASLTTKTGRANRVQLAVLAVRAGLAASGG